MKKTMTLNTISDKKNIQILNKNYNKKTILNQFQEQKFMSWANQNIKFNPLYTISLQELYLNYRIFMSLKFNMVPFTKRLFSITLRRKFQQKIQDKQIKFYTRSRVFIRGVRLI